MQQASPRGDVRYGALAWLNNACTIAIRHDAEPGGQVGSVHPNMWLYSTYWVAKPTALSREVEFFLRGLGALHGSFYARIQGELPYGCHIERRK
jgi:hypothetical protein